MGTNGDEYDGVARFDWTAAGAMRGGGMLVASGGGSTGKTEASNLAAGTGRAFNLDEPDVEVRETMVGFVCAAGVWTESELNACNAALASAHGLPISTHRHGIRFRLKPGHIASPVIHQG